jgi:hypothetical protein
MDLLGDGVRVGSFQGDRAPGLESERNQAPPDACL